eukprot:843810-Ditylum_brightwellii.AAC.1
MTTATRTTNMSKTKVVTLAEHNLAQNKTKQRISSIPPMKTEMEKFTGEMHPQSSFLVENLQKNLPGTKRLDLSI